MRKIISLAILLVVISTLLCIATPALAAPPEGKVECIVQPVIGGPNNPHLHDTQATVTIPANNPAIRWDPTDIMPGKVFVPVTPETPPPPGPM